MVAMTLGTKKLTKSDNIPLITFFFPVYIYILLHTLNYISKVINKLKAHYNFWTEILNWFKSNEALLR